MKICRRHKTFIHRILNILTHNLMQRANPPYKKIVKWCSKLCSIPKNKTETAPEVTKMICRTTLALANGRRRGHFKFEFSIQCSGTYHLTATLGNGSFLVSVLLSPQLKFVFNKNTGHVFTHAGHKRRGLLLHEYGFQVSKLSRTNTW